MAEPSSDDRLHVRLEWPTDDRASRPRRSAPTGTAGPPKPTSGTPEKPTPKKKAPAKVAPAPPPPGTARRARPLQARAPQTSARRASRPAAARTRPAEPHSAEFGVVLPGELSNAVVRPPDPVLASSLPAVADRVDALTHALISLHSLVSDRLSDQSGQIMDVIDGSVATLSRRDDAQMKTLEDLAGQVRALREGQVELVSALAELLQRAESPPPAPADPPVSPLRHRVSRWLSGAADSVGARRPPGG